MSGLKKQLKKNPIIVSCIRSIKGFKNKQFKFINLNILKYLSPSSKFLGPPKHELFTWEQVENYVAEKQTNKLKPFIKKLYEQQLNFQEPILTIGTPTPGAALEPKKNVRYCEYVCMFPNGRISMGDFNIITEDDYFIQPLSNYYDHKLNSHALYNKLKLPKTKKLNGRTLFLKGGDKAYYHVIHDSVCAFKLILDADIDINTVDRFLVYDYDDKWYTKVYEKLGLPKHKFMKGDMREDYECEQLFIASYFEHHGTWYSDFLKKHFCLQNHYKTSMAKSCL